MKRELLDKLDVLSKCLPPNTLDELIDELGGPDNVAEVSRLNCLIWPRVLLLRAFHEPLTPESDQHLISPNSITPASHSKVMRVEEMITN